MRRSRRVDGFAVHAAIAIGDGHARGEPTANQSVPVACRITPPPTITAWKAEPSTLRQLVEGGLPQVLDFAPARQAQLALLDRKAVDAGIVHLEVARGVQ